jgi:hypothetical protein
VFVLAETFSRESMGWRDQIHGKHCNELQARRDYCTDKETSINIVATRLQAENHSIDIKPRPEIRIANYPRRGLQKKLLVDAFRALQLWNTTTETLEQLAERFTGVSKNDVRRSIEYAVAHAIGAGSLARPLPEPGVRIPKPPRPPREPKAPREPRPPRVRPSRAIAPPKFTRENPAAPIPADMPKAAPFNSEVEAILATKDDNYSNYRESMREMRRWIIEAFDNYFADGTAIWNGKTEVDWLTLNRIRNAMNRERRPDLWTKCVLALREWHKINGTKCPHPGPGRPREGKYSLPEAIVGRMGGMNNSQIGRKLGVSGTTIREALRLADLEVTSAA